MAQKPTSKDDSGILNIQPLQRAQLTFYLIGETPLIMNRMSEKARHQLMLPPLPKNQAEKIMTLKHDPYAEFRGSAYISKRNSDGTFLHMPGGAFKSAIANAAIDIPGAKKAAIGRLIALSSVTVDIWGIPQLKFDMVRQAGPNGAPDTRFRCCIPSWCCMIIVRFVPQLVPPQSLANLIDAAGMLRGVGDGRVEKGALDYGQFRIVEGPDDPDFRQIVEDGGREAQMAAIENPEPYDDETEEMLTYWTEEVERRRSFPAELPKRSRKAKSSNGLEQQEVTQ